MLLLKAPIVPRDDGSGGVGDPGIYDNRLYSRYGGNANDDYRGMIVFNDPYGGGNGQLDDFDPPSADYDPSGAPSVPSYEDESPAYNGGNNGSNNNGRNNNGPTTSTQFNNYLQNVFNNAPDGSTKISNGAGDDGSLTYYTYNQVSDTKDGQYVTTTYKGASNTNLGDAVGTYNYVGSRTSVDFGAIAGETAGIAEYTGLAADVSAEAFKTTAEAADIVSKGTFLVGTAADFYLSSTINPQTGKPYQSWAETGTNTGVGAAASYIGGVPGIFLQVEYSQTKMLLNLADEHPEYFESGFRMRY
jgi:hypothetical protein